jgi:AraC-like DNA-binding protein
MAARPSTMILTQGRPSTARTNETVDRVNVVIRENRRLTIREIADELNLSFATCQAILTQDLGMRRVSEKLVPRLLTQEQTERRAPACRELLQRAENEATFLPIIITGDESWIYGYDPDTKQNVVTMEDAVVTSAEESEESLVKCQDNADRFL